MFKKQNKIINKRWKRYYSGYLRFFSVKKKIKTDLEKNKQIMVIIVKKNSQAILYTVTFYYHYDHM